MSSKHVLFIQGGASTEDYEADKKLVDSLQHNLGTAYCIHYPRLANESLPDLGRIKQIDHEVSRIEGELILIGHSLGASMLLKYVSETEIRKKITGIFLLSTPFWSGDEEWKEGFKLKEDFAEQLPRDVPIFLYHGQDDQQVPLAHLALYRQQLPGATFRELASGGHQLNNDLTMVANDLLAL